MNRQETLLKTIQEKPLSFKHRANKDFWKRYLALGDAYVWFWIGPQAEYARILS